MDRLIIDLGLDGREIYWHLTHIVESVNVIIAELISGDHIIKTAEKMEETNKEEIKQEDIDEDEDELERQEEATFFSPERGNVAFSSAIDCWAFNLHNMAIRVGKKLGMNSKVLRRYLWGEFYFANKKIVKKAPRNDSKELFV